MIESCRSLTLLVLFGAGVQAAQPAQFVERLRDGDPQTVVTYGTSLTAGGAWSPQLSSRLSAAYPGELTWVNSGLSGKASNSGVANLSSRVLSHSPDAVFIEFAMNDAFTAYEDGNIDQGISVAHARTNLESMIDSIQSQNPAAEVFLQTTNPAWDAPNGNLSGTKRPDLPDYYQMYRDVGAERGLTLIDNHMVWSTLQQNDPKEFQSRVADGTHPDALGYQRYATPALLYALGAEMGPCLLVELGTGRSVLHNQSADSVELIGYTISSASGTLLPDWDGLSSTAPDTWEKANPTPENLSELSRTTSEVVAANAVRPLGQVWDPAKSLDLTLRYQTPNGALHSGSVVYLQDLGELATVAGDYNRDGIVDFADYQTWRDAYGSPGPPSGGVNADGNGDGRVDAADYSIWRDHAAAVAKTALDYALPVPEPTAGLAGATASLLLLSRSTNTRAIRP
ncbi:GDSL-like Lipase/Acylhydrolase [Posidoniimonas polymericola]|uniref:GDSL-like Lipase/Acylhydrolase n=1 Tax=Posidoniimonas polymericola TaxID=2528002 RepID=A0A5C5ZFZ0_9BACT|nr:GDSL-type esterase/lipase family protein [Posidoniimonas polymericola]TWT85957.1 GDSL-like Lipase/Acylhydrolase [Posidoniimonas polymericola]